MDYEKVRILNYEEEWPGTHAGVVGVVLSLSVGMLTEFVFESSDRNFIVKRNVDKSKQIVKVTNKKFEL